MSKIKCMLGLALVAALTAFALSAFAATSATAATAPALKVCKLVPSSLKGLWGVGEPACASSNYVENGEYAWSWADAGGTATFYCVLGGTKFTDALCEHPGTGNFGEALVVEEFPKELGLLLKSTLLGELIGVKTEIICTEGTFGAQPSTATLAIKIVIKYTGCTIPKPANCEPGNPGKTAGTIETEPLVGHLQSLKLVVFLPETGTTFVEIEYKLPAGVNCVLHGQIFPIKGTQSCDFEPSAQTPAIDHLLVCKKTGSLLKFGTEKSTYEGVVHIHLEGLPYWKIQ